MDSNVATVTLTVSAAPVTSATSSSSGSGISGASGTNSAPSYVYGTVPASYSSGPVASTSVGGTGSGYGSGGSEGAGVTGSESQALGSNGNETPGNQSPISNPPTPSFQGYFGSPENPVSFPMPMPPPTLGHHSSDVERRTSNVERGEAARVEPRAPASPQLGGGGSSGKREASLVERRTSSVDRGGAALPVQVGVAALFALGSLVATLVSYGRKIGNLFKTWKK